MVALEDGAASEDGALSPHQQVSEYLVLLFRSGEELHVYSTAPPFGGTIIYITGLAMTALMMIRVIRVITQIVRHGDWLGHEPN